MTFLYYRKGNGQNYPKSLFLNAFINVEISFLQIGSKYLLLLIKSGIDLTVRSSQYFKARIILLNISYGEFKGHLSLYDLSSTSPFYNFTDSFIIALNAYYKKMESSSTNCTMRTGLKFAEVELISSSS